MVGLFTQTDTRQSSGLGAHTQYVRSPQALGLNNNIDEWVDDCQYTFYNLKFFEV
jgi:hypothetical protein